MNFRILRKIFLSFFALSFGLIASAQSDSTNLEERQDDFINNPSNNPFDLDDPKAIVKEVVYDPTTDTYVITETVNGVNIKPPTYMTFEEYIAYTTSKEMDDYWKQKSNTKNLIENSSTIIPPINVNKQFFNKLFGSNTIDIRPQGNVEVTLGGQGQFYDNPNIPLRNRRTGGLLFDMGINMSVTGKIGDKMQLTLKYNNQTGFSFDNQFKLQYTGEEDDIIQLLDGGNVSFPLETQLITGAQSLQGFKSKLRFGHLTITSVFSEQQSQKQSLTIDDGAQTQPFEINADQFEADKHYFLTQYFEQQYDQALSEQPNILSLITIEEIEVWVTNRSNQTQNVRDVVALMDLGENDPYSPQINALAGSSLPSNGANNLYSRLISDPNTRYVDNVVTELQGPNFNLNPIEDYEKTFAKLLTPSEYTFNPQLGYISLNSALQPNQILGVAFKYTYNGQVFQVGELSRNVPPDSLTTSKSLFVKMLRSTSQRPDLPTWDLMMRNIYSLGAFQISPEDFRLNIFYKDPGGGEKRFLPKGNLSDQQIISVLSLDNLNNQGDPQPDGIFDFQPQVTIIPQSGRLIFPVVKPFGDHLANQLIEAGNPELVDLYAYPELYDSALFLAQQLPEKNRFVIRGTYKGRGGSTIQLNAFNLPENSVTVSMGGRRLDEGQDYTVDYNIGVVTIINDALLNSGQQIKVDFENNALFGFQKRSLIATRLDYKVSDKIQIGGTVMNMAERPFSRKVNIGDDPINNTILGLDFKYGTDLPFLTKVLDALPVYNTKEMSNIAVQGEVAHLIPGHNRFVGKGDEATVYLDDFEGSSSAIDLKGAPQNWRLASTPKGATNSAGSVLFPEADLSKDLRYNYNRAKLAWFNIDISLLDNRNFSPSEVFDNLEGKANHYVRAVYQNELYPNNQQPFINPLFTLDLAYYPEERGPYNYEDENPSIYSKGLRPDGRLIDPKSRWGGIMRGVETNNFETANVEYVEFWMMDPFIYDDNHRGGQMHLNLGTISEDILRDSKMMYEHGLSDDESLTDTTAWGKAPKTQPITNAFSNDNTLRDVQDVGFDGLDDAAETEKFDAFINGLNIDQAAKDKIIADPSQDNFLHYMSEEYNGVSDIIKRYKNFSNTQGNSPFSTGGLTLSGTNNPDQEDLNRDNSLNENEAFYQYIVDLYPDMNVDNHPYIVSVLEKDGFEIYDNQVPDYKWYQFRIPVRDFDGRIGNIQDFTSIQFARMFLTGFEDSVNIRLATLELIRNQWRTYNFDLSTPGAQINLDEDGTFFNVTQVNFEESNTKDPVNYILPPDIVREQGVATNANTVIEQNEQAISANVCGLKDGDARAIFKNIDIDFRNYKRIILDIHANRLAGEVMPDDGSMTAFARFGVDFRENYYEYEIPLAFTPDRNDYDNDIEADKLIVWPESNKMDLRLQDLIDAKKERNALGLPKTSPYSFTTTDGRVIRIKGTPDIGSVQIMMLGIRNPSKDDALNPINNDDGLSKCAEIWFNELRLSGFDEKTGSAALASVAIKLADLGNINLATNMHGIGFGQVDMQVDQRYQNNYIQYSLSGNLELGKFFGEKAKIRLPFYGSLSQNFSTPEYDPYQLDITSEDMFNTLSGDSLRNYKKTVQTINTRRGFNFTNVRKLPEDNVKLLLPFNPSNFALTYAYTEEIFSDPFTENDYVRNHLGRLDYNYSLKPKYFYPFKKLIKSRSKWFDIIKDINMNFFPSVMSFNTQMSRQFGELKLRQLDGEDFNLPSTFNKFFTWDRNYSFNYNPFKSLSINYGAVNNARIDEAVGIIDTQAERDEIWNNIKNGGRNTNFSQNLSASYTLPLNKIPLLNFTTTKVSYTSAYNWIASPLRQGENGLLTQNSLGNTMTNSQGLSLNSSLTMSKLYNSIPYLKKFNARSSGNKTKEAKQKKKANIIKARAKIDKEIDKLKAKIIKEKENLQKIKDQEDVLKEKQKKQEKAIKKKIKNYKKQIRTRRKNKAKKQVPASVIENIVFKPLMMIKKVNLNYTENRATTLPGYVPNTRFFGIDDKQRQAPGWDFVFGNQPGFKLFEGFDADRRDAWLDDAARQNWVSSDTLLNQKFNQTFSKTFSLKATLEPFNGLKIDLNLDQNETINHSQFFKKTEENGDWEHLLPAEMGSYSVSTITLKTMFRPYDEDWLNETYRAFESNRSIISRRLQEQDPTSIGNYINPSDTVSPEDPNYAAGYGPTSQDVLIPSFLAAYKGVSADKANLNPFRAFPLPNWKITYNGLTKMKWAKKIFSNFSIRSGYGSRMQVNSFQTNFDNTEFDLSTGELPRDSLNGNNFSQYNIPSIIISEQLNPLIGIDMTFKNGLTARADYAKRRSMSMNVTDYQMIENNSETWTLGVGYRIKGLKLPIKVKKEAVVLYNELNMRFDFSLRDNVIVNHKLDQGVSLPSSGAQTITISPSIDYVINKQFNIRIFYDYSRTNPKTAASFASSNTRAGVTLRFSLADF